MQETSRFLKKNMSGHFRFIHFLKMGKCDDVKIIDIDNKDDRGWTLLHYACFYNDIDIVKLCINNGANVNANSKFNTTPLILATQHNHYAIVKLLLEHRADSSHDNLVGVGSIGVAKKCHYHNILELFEHNFPVAQR